MRRQVTTFLIVLGMSAAAGAQTIGLPLPSMGLPLPQIGLPLPPTGLPPLRTAPQTPPSAPAPDRRPSRNVRTGRGTTAVVYFVPMYGWPGAGAALPGPPGPSVPAPLPPVEVQPQVEPHLPDAGSAAPDHPLSAIGPTATTPEPPPPPSTIYLIPGCYVGNLPPRDVTLPAGCDPANASVFPSRR